MSVRLFALLSVVTFALGSSASAQDLLRWKFRSGDNLRYSVVQNMESTTAFGDEPVTSTFNQTINMSWQVLSVAAGGETILNQVFDRVRLSMEGGPAGTIEFDTHTKTPSDNPITKALGDVFGNIVGQQFQVSMQPTGAINNVKVPDPLLEAVRKSAAGQQGALDEKMLKDMMKQSAVMLPNESVSPGSRWSSQQNIQMPFGTMTITSAMTYAQRDASGNAVIDFVPSVTITPREGSPTKMTLNSADGRGRIIFDVARGRVNRTQLDLKMQMTMEVNGQKLPQTVHNVTSMTLIP